MKIDYSVCTDEERNQVEKDWMLKGWKCIYRTGLFEEHGIAYPKRLLHVWKLEE